MGVNNDEGPSQNEDVFNDRLEGCRGVFLVGEECIRFDAAISVNHTL